MVKDKEDNEMYLNMDLVYKVTDDDNGKEIGSPYFKSNKPGTCLLGQTPGVNK